jgi:DNA-binding transcriptional ArsR family regulator
MNITLETGFKMSMSQAKKRILKVLSEAGEPMKLQNIAKETGLGVSSAVMHLLWLGKAGYVSTPRKSYYVITESGKEVVAAPKVDIKQVSHILRELPLNQAFHFYTGIDRYLGVYANSLTDFCKKIMGVTSESIEFHLRRGDFESWLQGLGDLELAEKVGLIRGMELSQKGLRKKVYDAVKSRCDELASLF